VTVRRSLLRQYTIFGVGLTAIVAVGSLFITSVVTRSGLEDVFRQRLARAEEVLRQYTRVNHLVRVNQIEAALTSPRFLAALETADPATVAEEVPTHTSLADADFLLVTTLDGEPLFFTDDRPEVLRGIALDHARAASDGIEVENVVSNGQVYELVRTKVVANNGRPLGVIVSGRSLADAYAEDLKRLTGFDVVLGLGGKTVGGSDGRLLGVDLAEHGVTSIEIDGEQLLASRTEDPVSGMSVTFVGSIDEAIAPVMTRVRALLLALAVAGSAVAVLVLSLFTRSRVSRQVQRLVEHAERIARGDLDFAIQPDGEDELGHLAAKLEEMRARLDASRTELERAHHDRLDGERLAALGRFATGIVHDFKNPMAVVLGTADLIEAREPANDRLAKQCGVIRTQVDRMNSLARDVLDYAKGRSVLDVETVELDAWLRDLAASHAASFQRAGVKLAVEGSGELFVLFDPARMRRVIDNIVNNAREASRVGDTVALRWSREELGDIRVEIADQGPGIPAELMDRLFDPFVTAGKEGGTGLGLAIARKIVEDHGARLEVESVPGRGATFVLRLPQKLRVAQTPRMEAVTS
jgi:signal transduction histidine kinase